MWSSSPSTSNAFDYLLTGVVPWLLVVGAGVVNVLLATGALRPGKVPWPMVLLGGDAARRSCLIVIRLIVGQDVDAREGTSTSTSPGASASG